MRYNLESSLEIFHRFVQWTHDIKGKGEYHYRRRRHS